MARVSAEGATREFLGGAGFPAFAVTLLALVGAGMVAILVVPSGEGGLGAFADEFRRWCFGWDPTTGRYDLALSFVMLSPPWMLAAMIVALWWRPLRRAFARPARLARPAGAAALVVAAIAGSFAWLAPAAPAGEIPFPARELRTAHPAPSLQLTNQAGEPVDLAALRGKVVMLTAVYASCGHTCPAILTQARTAIEALPAAQREDLRVVAVTIDPAHDSPAVLAELAGRHELERPLYQLVTGAPPEVERVLDQMEVARVRDPETGVIDHANLFLLLDREGRVAYRLTLGERQQRWLADALGVLLEEPSHDG